MMREERYPLRQVILDDLTSHNKVALILLVLVVISAFATVWVTHQTRLLTVEQSDLAYKNQKLDNQYIHLQLEEDSSSERSIIDAFAIKFGLQPVDKSQEVILVR
ncbi:cell division protein FtsL [Otariodibacter oris]|nr:cell division protein FtsL [Otariodibacter oris]